MMKYRVGDTILEYKVVGQGKPILFFHGWGMDHRNMSGCFEPVFLKHEQQYRRIYVDLPGMGTSKAGESITSSDDILEVLHLFAKDIIGEPFLLVGESYGGYLARGFVHHFLEHVLDGAFSFPVDQLAEPFTKPGLILTGKMDTEVGYKDQFELLNIYLRATYCAFDEAGHNLQIEQPEMFQNMVTHWLINVENEGEF